MSLEDPQLRALCDRTRIHPDSIRTIERIRARYEEENPVERSSLQKILDDLEDKEISEIHQEEQMEAHRAELRNASRRFIEMLADEADRESDWSIEEWKQTIQEHRPMAIDIANEMGLPIDEVFRAVEEMIAGHFGEITANSIDPDLQVLSPKDRSRFPTREKITARLSDSVADSMGENVAKLMATQKAVRKYFADVFHTSMTEGH